MTDLFNIDNKPEIDPNKNYLEDYVGEGKKFKSAEDLAKGKAESDLFIERLQRENAEMRGELKTRITLEEAVQRISSLEPRSPSNDGDPPRREGDDGTSVVTPDKLDALLDEALSKREQANQRQRNTEFVKTKLQETFGANFARELKERAAKLGVGEQFLNNLAAEQPGAFLKLFDIGTTKREADSTVFTPPRTSVNSDAQTFRPGNDGVRHKSYYDNIRKTDPTRYWTPAVQNEMHKEAIRQGPAFFDS